MPSTSSSEVHGKLARSHLRLNHKTGKLEPSFTEFKNPIHPFLARILRRLAHLHLVRIYTNSEPPPSLGSSSAVPKSSHETQVEKDPNEIIACSNFTIINLALVVFGPMKEDHLCLTLLGLQAVCGIFGFVIRYRLAFLIYDRES